MILTKLDIFDVRNIEYAQLNPSPRINLILGPNGSGKTSLLEAIFLLGRARSFRSSRAAQLIRHGRDSLTVSGRVQGDSAPGLTSLGVRLSKKQREIALRGHKLTSSAELIRAFPVLLVQPASHALLEQSPKSRRQFLDWGAFHLDPDYLSHWRGYVRALSQRNALLRLGDNRNVETWNHELARYGTIVAESRAAYLERLRPCFQEVVRYFLGQYTFTLSLSDGWDSGTSPLISVLTNSWEQDRKLGYTHSGPHRADFAIQVDGKAARNFLSRGQMKLLIISLLLAQAQCLEPAQGGGGCILIDDLASELDERNRIRLLEFLAAREGQCFITATDGRVRHELKADLTAVYDIANGRVEQI
ncbi:DNA replication/repair protein RecF [Methylococcus sp. EFPC2]|uniref:DNA replication/repair protein RecF n=1 Tax=Methylococcus sp. EFPC2 TaxID=2812648 RepID=UPI0019683A3F|nr:DNA replication/repair protein RecF [Methylococcus sp. EFPC2]QSA96767.1 DNA replication/repair protein RecF [Methylococcus sp. EFPC2]